MTPSSVTATGATAIGARPAIVACSNQGRSRKTATKVARYIASGMTHRNGAAAMSVVANEVIAITSPDGTAASAVQRSRSANEGRAPEAIEAGTSGSARRATSSPAMATNTASAANPNDHRCACSRSGNNGSITNG